MITHDYVQVNHSCYWTAKCTALEIFFALSSHVWCVISRNYGSKDIQKKYHLKESLYWDGLKINFSSGHGRTFSIEVGAIRKRWLCRKNVYNNMCMLWGFGKTKMITTLLLIRPSWTSQNVYITLLRISIQRSFYSS